VQHVTGAHDANIWALAVGDGVLFSGDTDGVIKVCEEFREVSVLIKEGVGYAIDALRAHNERAHRTNFATSCP